MRYRLGRLRAIEIDDQVVPARQRRHHILRLDEGEQAYGAQGVEREVTTAKVTRLRRDLRRLDRERTRRRRESRKGRRAA